MDFSDENLDKCAPLLHETILFCRKNESRTREQLLKSAHPPDPTHAGTKYHNKQDTDIFRKNVKKQTKIKIRVYIPP